MVLLAFLGGACGGSLAAGFGRGADALNQAGAADDPAERAWDDAQAATPRKRPHLLMRAARETAAAQMALADDYRRQGRLRRAANAYQALVHTFHEAPEAPRAQLALAQVLQERRRHEQAFDEYQYLIERFAGRFPHEDVIAAQFQAANVTMTRRHFPGFRSPERALPMFERMIANAPYWSRADEVQFSIGLVNEEMGELETAAQAFEHVRYRYPESGLAADAARRRALCLARLADKAPRDENRARAALSALAAFLRDFPGHAATEELSGRLDRLRDRLARAYYARAEYYDRLARRPAAAVIAYKDFLRQFPNADLAAAARARLAALETATERTP